MDVCIQPLSLQPQPYGHTGTDASLDAKNSNGKPPAGMDYWIDLHEIPTLL